MNISSVIVGHPTRLSAASGLAQITEGSLCLDTGGIGAVANHEKALRMGRTDSDWTLILEDDALPVEGFMRCVVTALEMCPMNVASFYLGRSRPREVQKRIPAAIGSGKDWIVCNQLLHAVCFAVRTPLIDPLLGKCRVKTRMDVDQRYGDGLRKLGEKVAYSMPSLVDHADGEPLIGVRANGKVRQPEVEPRVAWRVRPKAVWSSDYHLL